MYIESNGQLWKRPWPPLKEHKDKVPITRNGGWAAQESTDGEFLYYLKTDMNGNSLWRAPVEGGEEIQLIEAVCNYNFAVVEDGIFYIPEAPPGEASSIEYLNFQSGRTTRLATLPYRPAWGFSLSPDRRSILYSQYQDWNGDLFMVENFR